MTQISFYARSFFATALGLVPFALVAQSPAPVGSSDPVPLGPLTREALKITPDQAPVVAPAPPQIPAGQVFDPQAGRRLHPRSISARNDAVSEKPTISVRHQHSWQPILVLPGGPGEASATTWTGFWLDCEYHVSQVGKSILAESRQDSVRLFDASGRATDQIKVTVGADGTIHLPISFDASERDGVIYFRRGDAETRVFLRRWPMGLKRPR